MKKFIKNLLAPVIEAFTQFSSGYHLTIDEIDKDDLTSITVNSPFGKLYTVEFNSGSSLPNYVSDEFIDSLAKDFCYTQDGFFSYVLLKNGLFQKTLLFTHNKTIAERFASHYNTMFYQFDEIINTLLALYFHNRYRIDYVKKQLHAEMSVDFSKWENPTYSFEALAKEAVYKNIKSSHLFQAYRMNEDMVYKPFDVDQFFEIPFTGALYFFVNFNKRAMITSLEEKKIPLWFTFNNDKKTISQIEKQIENGEERLAMINLVLWIQGEETQDFDPMNTANRIGALCSASFFELSRNKLAILQKTPLVVRNGYFNKIVEAKFLYNKIGCCHKCDTDMPDLCGIDKNQKFINFGFKQTTQRHSSPAPHAFLIGTSGSGKTVQASAVAGQLMEINFSTGKLPEIMKNNFRLFDIKRSFAHLINWVSEKNPGRVKSASFDLNKFAYNIVNCRVYHSPLTGITIDENDLSLVTTIINLILASGRDDSTAQLDAIEEGFFKEYLTEIYATGDFETKYIQEIESSHPDAYNKLLSLGYKPNSKTSEIKEEEFDYLKKPLIGTLVKAINLAVTHRHMADREDKQKVLNSLRMKLEMLEKNKIFNTYDKFDFAQAEIMYFDLDPIVGLKEFSAITMAMQTIVSRFDKVSQRAKRDKGLPRPMIYYMYEEARNIFENRLFKESDILERAILEWRSDDMLFFAITQEVQHIPQSVFRGIKNRLILLTAEDAKKRQEQINLLSERMNLGEEEINFLTNLPKYTIAVSTESGMFSLKILSLPKDKPLLDIIEGTVQNKRRVSDTANIG